jgi:hypothetical protein
MYGAYGGDVVAHEVSDIPTPAKCLMHDTVFGGGSRSLDILKTLIDLGVLVQLRFKMCKLRDLPNVTLSHVAQFGSKYEKFKDKVWDPGGGVVRTANNTPYSESLNVGTRDQPPLPNSEHCYRFQLTEVTPDLALWRSKASFVGL